MRARTHGGFQGFQTEEKYDGLTDQPINVTKVVAKDPLSIGCRVSSIRNYLDETWESRIRYYSCYVYARACMHATYSPL